MRILKGNRTPALLVIASMLALLVAACGGGSGGSSGSTAFSVVGYQMGGARQGVTLPLAMASATVSTLPGKIDWPFYITTDGTNLYVADCGWVNQDIIKISIANGQSSVIAGSAVAGAADGTGTAATFRCPAGITTDGTNLYVADSNNNTIRKIAPASGSLADMTSANALVTTLAGQPGVAGAADGIGSGATFNIPNGLTTDGTYLYVADANNNKIRMIAPTGGTTLANMTSAVAVVTSKTGTANTAMASGVADGSNATAAFNSPVDITTDGINLYVADASNHEIRMIASGQVSTLAGSTLAGSGVQDGTGAAATFFWPYGITTDGTNLYVTDANNKVRMIAPTGGVKLASMTSATALVTSITGPANTTVASGVTDGAAAGASFNNPNGLTTDGKSLYVMDSDNGLVRKVH